MKNLFAATYAPMDKYKEINLDIVENYSQFLQSNGVAGVFVNGSTGDFVSLTTQERIVLLNEWAKYKSSDFYLFNHVGHTSIKEAKLLAENSEGKADAIAAIAPYYFLPGTLRNLVDYCAQIAASAPNTPFYYYHLPVLTGVDFPMEQFARRAKAHIPNFKGIKFTQNDIVAYKLVKDAEPELDIFFGVDEAFLPSLSVGATGWVGSTYNQLAPLYAAIQNAFSSNNIKKANHLQGLGISFVKTLSSYGNFNGGGKSFMKHLGVDCGPSRYPHPSLNDIDIKEASLLLNKLGLDEYYCKSPFK